MSTVSGTHSRRGSYDIGGAPVAIATPMSVASVAPLSLAIALSRSSSANSSTTGNGGIVPLASPRGASGERFKHYDEHIVTIEELERRLDTNRLSGLLAHRVSRTQNETPRLNLLPTDAEVGHGSIHELVAVLRDGSWIHTRAENLLMGDVISLKEGQCVPADVRIIDCDGMWVDQSALLGKRAPEPRVATTSSVFDAAEATVHYLESPTMAFYGTVVTKGQGKALVVRTGDETVLGGIATKLLQCKRAAAKHADVPVSESMKQLDVFCKSEKLPAAIHRVSALVVEHSEIVKRSIISSSFAVNPPVIIELEDDHLANETPSEELEREIALQMANCSAFNSDARFFMNALAACRHRVESVAPPPANGSVDQSTTANGKRVPSLPKSSPIAAPVVLDPLRDQNAILWFSTHFGLGSPKNSMNKKTRCSTLLHGQISGCKVYVHFDQEHGAHVVVLQGPAREVLSRCGKVRRDEAVAPLETMDLAQVQAMVVDLEARGQTVVSFAELYLDPAIYPVGVKFDIESFNFPTSNMCYLGSLGLIEKIQPEVVIMGSFARSADVRLLVAANDREFPMEADADDDAESPDQGDVDEDALVGEAHRVKPLTVITVKLRDSTTGEIVEMEACVFRSNVLSVSNTLSQWKEILLERPIVIFDGCSSSHIDLLVETLQELGECVGLVASGNANAIAIANADVGFAIPSQDFVDLGEDAADVVLASATCPRSDAIRLIEIAKKVPRLDSPRNKDHDQRTMSAAQAKNIMANLFRESLTVGRALGLNGNELKICFDRVLHDGATATTMNPTNNSLASPRASSPNALFPPLSPSKFPASAFRSSGFLSTNPKLGVAALSAGVAGVGPSAPANLSSVMDTLATVAERRPSTGSGTKKAVGWQAVLSQTHAPVPLDPHHEPPLRSRPHSSDETSTTALPPPQSRPSSSSSSSTAGASPSSTHAPSDAIFNTQFTTAGRKFLTKVKKNRAMQVDRRTKGFQLGLQNHTVVVDAVTKKHYRVLIIDPDLQHREDLADALEHHFEILVAATNDRAFALLAMFKVDFVLLRLALGNDHSITTSTGLAFLKEIKKRYFHIPVSVLVKHGTGTWTGHSPGPGPGPGRAPTTTGTDPHYEKLVSQALALGACGFFEDEIDVETLIARLQKLLHSLVLANVELVKCRGKPLSTKDQIDDDGDDGPSTRATQEMIKRGTASQLSRRPATSKPASLVYDKDKMLLELSLKQRKQCLERRKQLTQTLATSHSVLGIGLATTDLQETRDEDLSLPSAMLLAASSSALSLGSVQRSKSIMKKITPLPSQQEISKRIYAKPHEIQVKIHKHLYETYHASKRDALPQDPLVRPSVAIDPATIFRSATNLLVGKAYRLYVEKRYEEALQQCDRAIRLQDNNVVQLAYLLRGVLYDLSGDYSNAETNFLTCVKLNPSMHQAHFNLCVCHLKMGKDQQALHDVTTAIHLDPTKEDYLMNRALIYRRLGEFGLAQAEYSKVESLRIAASASASARTLSMASTATTAMATATLSVLSRSSSTNVEDGLFEHLFGKPTLDKLALVCAPHDRDDAMLDQVVSRLQGVVFFQDFPCKVLLDVAHHLEYEVVACGTPFALAGDHPHNFYLLLSGRLSVRRQLGDFASSVTTHHIEPGMPFGSTGHGINAHTRLFADESSEIGILWPDAYDATIHSFCTDKNNEIFTFLQQLKAFKLFSPSELGHIIGISERRRYRIGEILLQQNDVPKSLVILRSGRCVMYQDFDKPPLCDGEEGDPRGKSKKKDQVLPYHHALATPDWPLGFRVHSDELKKKRTRQDRGARRNALLDKYTAPRQADLMLYTAHNNRSSMASPETLDSPTNQQGSSSSNAVLDKDAPTRRLGPGAIVGESGLLEQQHANAKCTVVAESVVEVLLFDHLRLQEMELSPDIMDEIMRYAPEYLNEEQALQQQVQEEAWNVYKNNRVLELSKTRWPQAKNHLRTLSNGFSIMLDTSKPRAQPLSSSSSPSSGSNNNNSHRSTATTAQ